MASRIEDRLVELSLRLAADRRRGLGAALGALLGGKKAGAAAARGGEAGDPEAEGPCGDRSAKANRCRKNRKCCTGLCDRKRGRCRCVPAGGACTETRNCCLRNGVQLSCANGVCAAPPKDGWSNLTTFGSIGTGPENFFDPYGVSVSPDLKTAFIADFFNNRISIWTRPDNKSTDWANQTTFGVKGSGPGELYGPSRVAVSADTLTCFVADYDNDRISVWVRPDADSTSWTNQTTFGVRGSGAEDFRQPTGVALSRDQLTLWVADTENNRVSVWTRPDAASTSWSNQTTFGSVGSLPDEFLEPIGVAASGDALTLWITEFGNNRVSIWTRPDAASTAWTNATTFGSGPGDSPESFYGPADLALSPDGLTVWIADNGNQRISVWTRPDGASISWTNLTTFGSFGTGNDQFEEPS
ncbi:MAG: hypothetical protein ACKOWF_00850, partial [Chloroflexota bacterium]